MLKFSSYPFSCNFGTNWPGFGCISMPMFVTGLCSSYAHGGMYRELVLCWDSPRWPFPLDHTNLTVFYFVCLDHKQRFYVSWKNTPPTQCIFQCLFNILIYINDWQQHKDIWELFWQPWGGQQSQQIEGTPGTGWLPLTTSWWTELARFINDNKQSHWVFLPLCYIVTIL